MGNFLNQRHLRPAAHEKRVVQVSPTSVLPAHVPKKDKQLMVNQRHLRPAVAPHEKRVVQVSPSSVLPAHVPKRDKPSPDPVNKRYVAKEWELLHTYS